jgi:hypothetical protein
MKQTTAALVVSLLLCTNPAEASQLKQKLNQITKGGNQLNLAEAQNQLEL